ncbi:MAG: HAMP domain-containing protein [Hyphomonadaceae bacterium]|nr:HAMP domain-containing protein [Clostridia bacterium]
MSTFIFIILLTLFFISIYIQDAMTEYFYNQKSVEILTKANMIANIVSGADTQEEYASSLGQLQMIKDSRVVVTDLDARVLYDSANQLVGVAFLEGNGIMLNALKGHNEAKRIKYSQLYEKKVEYGVAAAVPMLKERVTVGGVYVAVSAEDVEDILKNIRYNLIYIALLVSVFVGIFSAMLAGIITIPVERLTGIIKEMSEGKLYQQVEIKGRSEIAELGSAFNRMSTQLLREEEKRRQFVSDASHELKTPLSSIKILVDSMLNMQKLEPAITREFLGDINSEIDRLTRIIQNLLHMTKMDVTVNALEVKEINMKKLIEDVVKSIKPIARQKNLKLETVIPHVVKLWINEDEIWEAVFNIVDNAIKYTDDGGIVHITLNQFDQEVYITIEDNGIGLSAEEQEKIFERFYRVDKARDRQTGGTGLGLAIARQAVRNHGGDIDIESEEGKGSKFTIRLPYYEK